MLGTWSSIQEHYAIIVVLGNDNFTHCGIDLLVNPPSIETHVWRKLFIVGGEEVAATEKLHLSTAIGVPDRNEGTNVQDKAER